MTSLLLILSYPKFNFGFLAWFALAPLTISIWKAKSFKTALIAGLIAGFCFYSGILYWIYITMIAGGVSVGISIIGWLALSLILSLEFILISGFGFYIKKTGPSAFPYVFAAGWVLMEWFKIFLTSKAAWFPWFMLGYTQWQYLEISQIASITGAYGLSFLICFTGALLGTLFIRKGRVLVKILRFSPALFLIGALFLYGNFELKQSHRYPAKNISFSIIQPSIDFYKKWDEKYVSWIKSRIEGLLEKTRNPDVIVWPENSLPGWIDQPELMAWLKEISLKYKAQNIVGSASQSDGKYVSAFLINKEGEIESSYNKRQLVPFGEYVPLRSLLSDFINVIGELGEFERGAMKQNLFKVGNFKIGNAICYESIFPYLLREDALSGADIFVNITNDGWYLNTAAPYQHFLVNIFRSIENRKSLVRAANNGISALIDPWGRTVKKLNLNDYAVLNVQAPVYKDYGKSFYSKYGNWFVFCCFILVGAFMIVAIVF
ncbi:MAG: apolipoprotein N-acyltransferase [Elusimicrobiota bacterium]|nr:apolipoprotein N-acyltransferase [Elusimicrobiota bacterium]